MSIASFLAADPRSTAPAGSLVAPASSYRCACSRGCSDGCSCGSWRTPSGPASCGSSAISPTLHEPQAFARRLGELRRLDWVVYAKPPFGGPEQVLAYLGRYTHRVAIANSRLRSLADGKIRFTWKDYRADGKTKVMTLAADEFIRRFLLHTLPDGFHRIRHYGFLANGSRGDSLALCHRLLDARVTGAASEPTDNHTKGDRPLTAADFAICPDCGGTMRRIAAVPRSRNAAPFSCDTS